jgi:hypothetical protein
MKRVRGKKLVWIPMVLMILFGTMAFVRPAFANGIAGRIYLDPFTTSWTKPPKNPGDTFTVQVRISDVTECYLIVFSLGWDPTVILLDSVAQGNVLEPGTSFLIGSLPVSAGGSGPNDVLGGVTYTRLGAVAGVTLAWPVSGLVATLTFHMVTAVPASTNIMFLDTLDNPTRWTSSPLAVPPNNEYQYEWFQDPAHQIPLPDPLHMKGGEFILAFGAPYSPTAAFTWTPASPYDGQTVTFDASTSTKGFDGDDETPITNYAWNWGDGSPVENFPGPTGATHPFSPDGVYTVILTVTAPGIGPYIDPLYVPTDDVSHDITVLKAIVGRNIDLTTENTRSAYKTSSPWMKMVTTPVIGTGPNAPADAFGPQENVTLYANVTYNLCPVANKPVDFEIHSPTDNWVIFRQAFTDQNGIATITFRIPWPNTDGPAVVFGTWHAYASCDIADMKVYDTLDFKVGWIIDKTVTIDKPIPGVYHRGIDSIVTTETITNIGMIPRDVVITVTLYDELGFAVNYATITATIPSGTTTNYAISIFVPKYTVCGIGTLYMNVYGALPTQCGVSYCPENTVIFQVAC